MMQQQNRTTGMMLQWEKYYKKE